MAAKILATIFLVIVVIGIGLHLLFMLPLIVIAILLILGFIIGINMILAQVVQEDEEEEY